MLISSDQVLPRITSNVGVWGNQPESNPLAQFLGSLARLSHLPASVRAQYLTQLKAAERWELAIGDLIELGSRVKVAVAKLFHTPRAKGA